MKKVQHIVLLFVFLMIIHLEILPAPFDPGITTKMFFNPDTKIGMITFQNNNMGDASEILKELYLETKTK